MDKQDKDGHNQPKGNRKLEEKKKKQMSQKNLIKKN